MGAQPSKLSKVLSRSNDGSQPSPTKDRRRLHHHKNAPPITSLPLNTRLDGDVPSDDPSEANSSQMTGETPVGEAISESAFSSRSNLSSFLNNIRSKNKDGTSQDGSAVGDTAEEIQRLDDLQEQKLQKRINRQNQKKKTQQQPATSASPWSTLISHSPSPSMHSFNISAPAGERWSSSPKAKSATGVFSSLSPKNDPDLNASSPALVSPTFTVTAPVAKPAWHNSTNPSPASSLLSATSSQPSSKGDTGLPMGTLSIAQQTPRSRSKLSFIRGKAGFAWLEKRLPPGSSDQDEEKLNDNSWSYQQGQMLNEMEIEAAKGYVDRITDQHYLMKDVMGGNCHAPIDLAFKRVLENGCGAGDWTLDMASEKPETDFVACPQIMYTTSNAEKNTPILRPRGLLGADQSQQGTSPSLAPSSSASSFASSATGSSSLAPGSSSASSSTRPSLRPRNCQFLPDVPLNRLPFPNEQFDFVYQRRQNVVLLSTEWQRTVLELFRVLKRGGWVEILEPDLFLRGGGELCQLAGEYCVGIFEAMGRNPNVVHEMQHLLENAGFVNVAVKVWSIPLGWGGVIGQAMLVNQKQFVNELEPIYVRQGHGSSEEFREMSKSIFDEAIEKKAYINYHVVVGQKPASASDRLAHQQMQKQKEEEQLQQQQQQ